MDNDVVDRVLADLIEELAAIEHERWSHWQRHMHAVCEPGPDGTLVVPLRLVLQWQRQMATPYDALDPAEQASDREQVMRYLPRIAEALNRALDAQPDRR